MLAYTDDEVMLARSADDFLARFASTKHLRRLRDGRDDTGFDRGVWHEMARLGYAGVLVDEAHGGSAFGHVGAGLLCASFGRHLSTSPFLSSAVLGATALRSALASAQRCWLPRIAEGEAIVALAVDEGRRHAPASTALSAERSGEVHVLRGEKTLVVDGHVADAFVVLARTSGRPGDAAGLSLFLVEADRPGVSVRRQDMIDSRNAARVTFDGVRVATDTAIGPVDGAGPIIDDVLDAGRIALAAELVGIAREAFERTVTYLKRRRQFGHAIGSFQALQHRAAQLHGQIELAQSTVVKAARLRDLGDPRAALFASVAKAKAGDAAERATDEAVQMHGGIGMTDELDVGLYLKRARVAGTLLGDRHLHANRVATLLGF